MKSFSDLLDQYLNAKQDYDAAKEGFTGYDFGYCHADRVYRLHAARENLNQAFEKIAKGES